MADIIYNKISIAYLVEYHSENNQKPFIIYFKLKDKNEWQVYKSYVKIGFDFNKFENDGSTRSCKLIARKDILNVLAQEHNNCIFDVINSDTFFNFSSELQDAFFDSLLEI